MADRPSAIIGGSLVLDRRGAAMIAAALRLAAKAAGRNGIDYQGRAAYDDYAWLLAQADLVAAGSPAGTAEGTFRVDLPSSAGVPDLLTTAGAAAILGVSPRAVVKRIEAGTLPARRVGREWAITEYDVRRAARPDGRRRDAGRDVPGRLGRRAAGPGPEPLHLAAAGRGRGDRAAAADPGADGGGG